MKRTVQFFIAASVLLAQLACASSIAKTTNNEVFSNGDKEYQVIRNVVLIPDPGADTKPGPFFKGKKSPGKFKKPGKGNSDSNVQPNAALQRDGVVGKIGNMLLVRENSVVAQQAGLESPKASKSKAIYVQNTATEAYGIVNGEIFVELNNKSDAKGIASDYGLDFITFISSRSIALMQASNPADTLAVIEKLRSDNRVTSAEVRVITNLPTLY